jgi:hypothetical protein
VTTEQAAAPTPAEARAQVEAMRGDENHPLHSGDPEASATYERLVLLAYADPAALNAPRPVPAGLTTAQLDERIHAARAAMVQEDRGSPTYQRLLGEYEQLLQARHDPAAVARPAPEQSGETPADDAIAAADAASAAELAGLFDLVDGATWDEPMLAETRGVLREAFGADAVEPWTVRGVHTLRQVQAELATAGAPDPEATERELRRGWGAEYDDKIEAATDAWERLPARVRDNLTASGARYHPRFVQLLAEAGARLPREEE